MSECATCGRRTSGEEQGVGDASPYKMVSSRSQSVAGIRLDAHHNRTKPCGLGRPCPAAYRSRSRSGRGTASKHGLRPRRGGPQEHRDFRLRGHFLDTAAGKVDLYLADTGQYQRFLGAARTRRNVDASLIHVHPAKYSHAKLVSARDLVFTQDRLKFGFATNSFAVPEDGSGLIVGVADAAD